MLLLSAEEDGKAERINGSISGTARRRAGASKRPYCWGGDGVDDGGSVSLVDGLQLLLHRWNLDAKDGGAAR